MVSNQIFNRDLLKVNLNKNACKIIDNHFISQYSAKLIKEKLANISLKFSKILIIGIANHDMNKFILDLYPDAIIVNSSLSIELLKLNHCKYKLNIDEELLPFKNDSFDLIISLCNLHNINDIMGYLMQMRFVLKDKGIFISSFIGGDSYSQIRRAAIEADSKYNSIMARVAPMIDIKSAGMLLQKTGYFMPIIDSEQLNVEYEDIDKIFSDIKDMGESNILLKKSSRLTSPERFNMIKENYLANNKKDDIINIKYELINITAFKN